jgi:type II secretory pathway component PulK
MIATMIATIVAVIVAVLVANLACAPVAVRAHDVSVSRAPQPWHIAGDEALARAWLCGGVRWRRR